MKNVKNIYSEGINGTGQGVFCLFKQRFQQAGVDNVE
jgi:hypothetical protein